MHISFFRYIFVASKSMKVLKLKTNKMKNSFKVFEAHSGTSSKEIAKAKRLFNKMLKSNEIAAWAKGQEIQLVFTDVNSCIEVDFVIDEYGSVGTAVIYQG